MRESDRTFGNVYNQNQGQYNRQNQNYGSDWHRFNQRPAHNGQGQMPYQQNPQNQGNFQRSNRRDQGLTNNQGPRLH